MLNKDSLTQIGLHEGSIRAMPVVHNGGWYNSEGIKIGWGDLDASDFNKIQSILKDNEVFVVLNETDSYWNFVTKLADITYFNEVSKEEKHPSKTYIAENALYVITKQDFLCAFGEGEHANLKSSALNNVMHILETAS